MAAGTARFQQQHRLSSPSEFRIVFKSKVRSADARFLVLACENGLTYSRLGLAVSKEKIRKAVARNSIKRLIRESFRNNAGLLAGLDLVVLPQHKIDISDKQVLRDSLSLHWRTIAGAKTANKPD